MLCRIWLALPLCVALSTPGCTDLRELEGTWSGPRIGTDPILNIGFRDGASATLEVERVDLDGLRASLTTSGDELLDAEIRPLPSAEADVLGDITFVGSPARVYLAFAEANDGGGDALVLVALYEDDRIEVRLLRGGPTPLYGIFALER